MDVTDQLILRHYENNILCLSSPLNNTKAYTGVAQSTLTLSKNTWNCYHQGFKVLFIQNMDIERLNKFSHF